MSTIDPDITAYIHVLTLLFMKVIYIFKDINLLTDNT